MSTCNTETHSFPSASDRIADFLIRFDERALGAAHFTQTARAVIDTVSIACAGRLEPASDIMLDYLGGRSAVLDTVVWGTRQRLPLEEATLYNGTAGHVLDFDDVSSPMRGHPSIALLPALLALADAYDKTGAQLTAAFVAGFEVMIKLSKAMVGDHYAKGWHSTSSVGTLGATAACAHLLGLERAQIVSALGLAVAQTGGTRANFGTMAKSFQAGNCGAAAVRSVLLAQRGFDSSPMAVNGKYGYMSLYGNDEDLNAQLDTLGSGSLEIVDSGLEIKKYPLCYATHRTIDGVLDLKSEFGLTLDNIDRVDIRSNYRAMVPLIHPRPQSGLEAKFSMHYAVAAALHDGHVKLASFTDEAVRRAPLQQFFERVHASEDAGPASPRWNHIKIVTSSGRTIEKMVTKLRGGPDLPLTQPEVLEKASDCFLHGGCHASPQPFFDAALAIQSTRVRDILLACPV